MGHLNNRKCANKCMPLLRLALTTFFVCSAQKDMDSYRLKLAVILINYASNKIKAGPGFNNNSDADEPYPLEDN
jgi:hypothetical protein